MVPNEAEKPKGPSQEPSFWMLMRDKFHICFSLSDIEKVQEVLEQLWLLLCLFLGERLSGVEW